MPTRSLPDTVLTVEQKLAQERAILQYVIDNIPYLIFWKDRESRYLGCNKNFAALDGCSDPKEMIGKTDADTVWGEHAAQYRAFDRETMERGEPILDREELTHDEKGHERVVLTSKVPLRDQEGSVMGLLGILVDITERKHIEVELKRAKEAAEQAARAKSEFIANISHELRTPLTLVLGPIEALLAGEAGAIAEPVRAQLERARRNAGRLLNLVNDLLDFSKLEAGKVDIHWEAVHVSALLATLVQDAQPVARSRQIALAFHSELGDEAIPLDGRIFEKIAMNLIGNALKFTPAGGSVDVTLRAAGEERFELEVKDTGIGIPASRKHLLFQRFEQLDATATRKYEGTGLGLALVKEFAVAMGGEVGVESEEGRGSRFFVRLPRRADAIATHTLEAESMRARETAAARLEPLAVMPAAAPLSLRSPGAAAGAPRAPAPPSLRSPGAAVGAPRAPAPRVLVAEDNPDLRAHITELLSVEYEVIAVENGKQALDAALTRRPEVIVSDVMMPEMSGFELVSELKADGVLRHIPVLLLTARAGTDAIVSGLEGGADDYLTKPFSPAELRARVRAAYRLSCARDFSLIADELAQTRDLYVHAEQLLIAGQLADAKSDVELPPQVAPTRVALADVVERAAVAVKEAGRASAEIILEPNDAGVSASAAPDDLKLALVHLLAFLGRSGPSGAPINVVIEPGEQERRRIRVRRDGFRAPAGQDDVFRPRLHRDAEGGRIRLDAGLTIARVLVLRNDGQLSFEEGPLGASFCLELPA